MAVEKLDLDLDHAVYEIVVEMRRRRGIAQILERREFDWNQAKKVAEDQK